MWLRMCIGKGQLQEDGRRKLVTHFGLIKQVKQTYYDERFLFFVFQTAVSRKLRF